MVSCLSIRLRGVLLLVSQQKANHEKAPVCAAFVEEMRKVFGHDQIRVLYVKEGDFELERRND